MKSKWNVVWVVMGFLAVLSLAWSSCAPAAAPAAAPDPTAKPVPAPTVVPAAPTPAAPAADKPRQGGILKTTYLEDPAHYDTHQDIFYRGLDAQVPQYNLLIRPDPNDSSKVLPELADRWEVGPDGKVYTFYIRKGIKFHDGMPLTSADVKASFERIAWPPKGVTSFRQAYYAALEKIETPDDSTVKFILKRPQMSWPLMVAVPWNVIMPKHLLDKDQQIMKKTIVGTGAFKFKEHIRGVSFESVRNPDYWDKPLPYLDGIIRYQISDASSIKAAFRTGRVDLVMQNNSLTSPKEREALKKDVPGLAVQATVAPINFGLWMNHTRKPWSDARVRRAVALVLDRQPMIDMALKGQGALGGWLQPGSGWGMPIEELLKTPGYRKPTPEDVAEAKKLLADAGYPDGFKFDLFTRGLPMYVDLDIAGMGQLEKLGITAEIKQYETAAFQERMLGHDFSAMFYGLASRELPDPDQLLSGYLKDSPSNYGLYYNPEYDALYERQSQATDLTERKKLVLEMDKLLLKDLPTIPVFWRVYDSISWPYVKGYVNTGLYSDKDMQRVWLAK